MTGERTRRQTEPDKAQDRTGEYGGDDGALEHEREEIQPGEDTGIRGNPTQAKQYEPPAQQAERKQERDLGTGEENPG